MERIINTAAYVQKNSEGKMKGITFCCQMSMAVMKQHGESFFSKHPASVRNQIKLLYE